jgi:hypothetical protein
MYWRALRVSVPLCGQPHPGTLSLTFRISARAGEAAASMNRPAHAPAKKFLLFNILFLLVPSGIVRVFWRFCSETNYSRTVLYSY